MAWYINRTVQNVFDIGATKKAGTLLDIAVLFQFHRVVLLHIMLHVKISSFISSDCFEKLFLNIEYSQKDPG